MRHGMGVLICIYVLATRSVQLIKLNFLHIQNNHKRPCTLPPLQLLFEAKIYFLFFGGHPSWTTLYFPEEMDGSRLIELKPVLRRGEVVIRLPEVSRTEETVRRPVVVLAAGWPLCPG